MGQFTSDGGPRRSSSGGARAFARRGWLDPFRSFRSFRSFRPESSRCCGGWGRPRIGLAALLLAACGGTTRPGNATESARVPFIATSTSFDGFRSWRRIPIPNSDENLDGLVHVTGPRVVYLNRTPAKGSAQFPPGTILVKEQLNPALPPEQLKVFAMAKRGGDFNAQGAAGWEWFELSNTGSDRAPMILWRGIGAPAGESYSGNPAAGCNPCHMGARRNDYVQANELSLSTF